MNPTSVGPYLQLQNKCPYFNTKSSFSRGNSPLALHFSTENSKYLGIHAAIREHLPELDVRCQRDHDRKVERGEEERCLILKAIFFNRKSGFFKIGNQDSSIEN